LRLDYFYEAIARESLGATQRFGVATEFSGQTSMATMARKAMPHALPRKSVGTKKGANWRLNVEIYYCDSAIRSRVSV